jgi:hypothetical protein
MRWMYVNYRHKKFTHTEEGRGCQKNKEKGRKEQVRK